MQVRKAEKKDIDAIVTIHMARFSSFFLTTLGAPFLRVFYTAFLKNPAVLLVLEDKGIVKGFAAGSRNNRAFYKKLIISNLLQFAHVGINIFFTNNAALKRIISNIAKTQDNNLIFAELLSIATLKNKESYGKTLLAAFEREIAKDNIDRLSISLTTDYDNNEKAILFYKNNGYEVSEVFEGYQKRKMYRFIKNNITL